jgi:membrane-associated protein
VELIQWFIDLILHLDDHLVELLQQYGIWIYAILFLIVFAETGLVVTPFLPGDSLLFAIGALAAIDTSGTLTLPGSITVLLAAAILGNTCNYAIGRAIGPPAFSGKYRLLKVQYLEQTQEFFDKHGGKTIVLSRFLPILRTFAPFVAGVGRMPYSRFQLFNVTGAVAWVVLLVGAGYLFGNIPIVRDNFGIVTLVIIAVSLLPLVWVAIQQRNAKA